MSLLKDVCIPRLQRKINLNLIPVDRIIATGLAIGGGGGGGNIVLG